LSSSNESSATDDIRMKRRVCHISTVHVPIDVRVFYRECVSLVEAGYEVHLVIPADASKVEPGVHIHAIRRVNNRLLRMLFMPWVALVAALRTRADLYHYHDPELVPMGFVLRWLLGKRVVYDIHEPIPQQILGKQWLPKWLRRPIAVIYRAIERVLTPGQALVLANENNAGDYPARAIVVRNYPLLSEAFREAPTPVDRRPQPPLLVYVGAMSRDRGADVYVELAHRLAQTGRAFRMTLIGPCAPTYETHLRGRVEACGLGDVLTLMGRTEYHQAMRFVSEATIGLCVLLPTPNHRIALATKILEYMMLGTPVLASNIEGWRRYVDGERSGVMVDPEDMDDVVRGCERMLDDPAELCAMAARGVQAVRTKFNWSTEFEALSALYDRLMPVR
jgi:glycosyltransferase involved in cell wall biosynthesis